MEFRQLEYFLAVVDQGGLHRAAEHLYVSQPAVSQALRRLERELGVELFHRIGRGLVLTPAGRALVDPSRELVQSLDHARVTVAAVGGLSGGRLVVCSMPSQAVSPLAPLAARFRERYPGVELAVTTAAHPSVVCETVRRGSADVGLVAVPNAPLTEPGLTVEPIEVQSYLVIARNSTDLPPGKRARPGELRGLPLVVGQPGTGMRRAAEAILSVTDCTIAVEIEHREALLPLVLAGVGVAVVADSWRALATAAGLAVRPLAIDETLHVSLVTPQQRVAPAAAALMTMAHADGAVDRDADDPITR